MKAKFLNSYTFKSVSSHGNPCKTYCNVYDNGVTIVNQLILTSEEDLPRFTKIYSKFGKNLFVKDFGLKYESLVTIAELTTLILNEHKIKPEDLV